jgi:hypothetical protein
VVTNTWNVPAECAGAVTRSWVGDTNVVGNADPTLENFAVAPATNPVPVIVTLFPPPVGPALGATPETVGGTMKL